MMQTNPRIFRLNNGLLPSVEPLNISPEIARRFTNGSLPISQWTALSVDNRYLTHLLNLFFAWDGAISHTIHQTAFLEGIKAPEAAETLHVCSKFLVHALIAVSHLYLSQGVVQPRLREIQLRGRDFANEALRILDQDRQRPSIPLAQGLVLLLAYEVNNGHRNVALTLLDEFYRVSDALVVKYGCPIWTLDERASQFTHESEHVAFAIWGFFCLDAKLSLTFSRAMHIRQPQLPKPFTSSRSAGMTGSGATENFWFSYPDARATQPSHFREVVAHECQLAELAWEASPFFALSEANAPCPDYHAVKTIYKKLLAWNTGAVQEFLLTKAHLPSVLFLDVTFQMIQVKMLACLARCDSSEIALQAITSTTASHGGAILSSLFVYRAAYGIRHELWLAQACFVGLAAALHNHRDDAGLSRTIASACELLLSVGDFFPVANRYLWAVKALANRLDIVLPRACARLFFLLAAKDRRTILQNVNLVDLGSTKVDVSVGALSKPPCDFMFSGRIEGVQPLE